MDRKLRVAKTKLHAYDVLDEAWTNFEHMKESLASYDEIPDSYLEAVYELQQLTIKVKDLVVPTEEEIKLLEENGKFYVIL